MTYVVLGTAIPRTLNLTEVREYFRLFNHEPLFEEILREIK
jgi:hypothetical protein